MDAQSGNERQSYANAQSAGVRLPDEIFRRQHALRRQLQDPSSPAFNDPVRAAEIAGFVVNTTGTSQQVADGRHGFLSNSLCITTAIDAAVSRKVNTIEKLRRRASEGMDATKFVTVWNRDGSRHSIAVPNEAARRQWAHLWGDIENLFSGKGGDPRSDMLPHELAWAKDLEVCVEEEISRMSSADRYLLSSALLKLRQMQRILREEAIVRKLGKGIEEFEAEIGKEVTEEMKHVLSHFSQPEPIQGESDG